MTDKKPKYHFEGKRKNLKGKEVYVVIELKTNKILELDKGAFDKKAKAGEVEK